ncbi:methionine sulfoxide reductase A [Marinomonas sp. S3726]|uniref:peptide-methionine (S)-S-oxide reductase MsrA n=1 Tax=Marinomonas sp. S3726 TaxID=579484 RepID=UPI0005F9FCF0|nr:peptide-methionine (S)-S-oxide reductase MsrA [Marinomonas sp. S3726]KJZ14339.1 methionine sulfoxide reductase A [Marinomonas sp. S3726]
MFNQSKLQAIKAAIVPQNEALPGRNEEMKITAVHAVNNQDMKKSLQANEERIILGMGCFWGAERKLWNTPGVTVTSVGYAGGYTLNPTYEEVCSGATGHAEVVNVIFDRDLTSLDAVLKVFWENHNPAEGMKQGNDIGTQYRSAIYTTDESQQEVVEKSLNAYQKGLVESGYGEITTECAMIDTYYFAEEYHQQYLHKNVNGYCGLKGTGVTCSI